jgi:hypothetical protein
MKKLILLPFVLLFAFGCYRPNWYRPNTTYAQLNEDSNFCWTSLKLGASREEKISEYEKCMKEKGYQLRKEKTYTRNEPVQSSDEKVLVRTGWDHYHRPTCTTLRSAPPGYSVTKGYAEKQGYKPCPVCKP